MYDDEPTPARNQPLIKVYELLCSLIEALTPDTISQTLRDGSGERFNAYIDELISLTNDPKLNDFKVTIRTMKQGSSRPYVMGEAYVRQLTGVANYLWKVDEGLGYYCGAPPQPKFGKTSSAGPTFNNHLVAEQQAKQSMNVQIEFTQTIVTLTEKLTNLEHEFPDENSKENKFAKALKKNLPLVKDTLGIISIVLKIAGEIGLDPHKALKLLGLG